MKRDVTAFSCRQYDLLVVGGGIYGVCAAWEAALRGLTVALVERGDFSGATSSNHSKLAHGGIRYLQHASVSRVRESSHERSALLRIAPHLIYPLRILMPCFGHGRRGKGMLRAGFSIYDLLTLDRNQGIEDPKRRIPRAQFLTRKEVLELYPALPEQNLTGGAVFYDAQIYNPPRLALSFLRSAAEAGAAAANYLEVTRFLRKGNQVLGVEARDILSGRRIEIRARIVLNAAGPWASGLLLRGLGLSLGLATPIFSRDVALVARRRLPCKIGLACPTATRNADAVLDRGGRHLFLLPWREFTLIGVWHGVSTGSPDDVQVTNEELSKFVAEAN